MPLHTSVTTFRLEDANAALERVRRGQLEGAAVLTSASAA
jgi:D-arabinose 1-dehydrogenase-like Zn-dependent alcohol dehydrogenase